MTGSPGSRQPLGRCASRPRSEMKGDCTGATVPSRRWINSPGWSENRDRAFRSSAMTTQSPPRLPKIVTQAEWQAARQQLLAKEKQATRDRDRLAAERRRLPMVRIEKPYTFAGPAGKASLLDLFEGRRQLIVYHFMFAPSVDGWPSAGCPGCSMFVD